MKKIFLFAALVLALAVLPSIALAQNNVFTFDELTMPDTGYWNGKDTTVYNHFFGDTVIHFTNSFSDASGYEVWSGFAFSNWIDTATTGYDNQLSVWAVRHIAVMFSAWVMCQSTIQTQIIRQFL